MAQAMALTCSFYSQASTSTPLKIQPLHINPQTKAPPSNKVQKPKPRVKGIEFAVSITQSLNSSIVDFNRIHIHKKRHRIANKTLTGVTAQQLVVGAVVSLSLLLGSAAHGEEAGVRSGGAALFNRACIGCHVGGGNVVQAGATLFAGDLERNGVETEEEIFRVTYEGKGRMPGFGEECTPRGKCTFGPRLKDEEIRLLAQFVKFQAQQGWPKTD